MDEVDNYLTLNKLKPYEQILYNRNLLDPESKLFTINPSSSKLINSTFGDKLETIPRIVISLIPLEAKHNKALVFDETFQNWITENSRGLEPSPRAQLIYPFEKQIHRKGIVIAKTPGDDDDSDKFRNYFEFHKDGYLEYGLSEEVTYTVPRNDYPLLSLTGIVGRLWMFMEFAVRYYDFLNYKDKLLLTVNFANFKDFAIGGFEQPWAEPYTIHHSHPPINKYDNSFQIRKVLEADGLDVKQEIKSIASEISHAFGETIVKCFDEEGKFNTAGFRL